MNISSLHYAALALCMAVLCSFSLAPIAYADEPQDVPLIEGLIEDIDYEFNSIVVSGIAYRYGQKTSIIDTDKTGKSEFNLQPGLPVRLIIENSAHDNDTPDTMLDKIILLNISTEIQQDK